MDTQTFLNNLKRYADRSMESQQNSNDFFSYFEANHDIYVSATPEEREKIRGFVKSPRQEGEKPKSFFGGLFKKNSQVAHMLLLFVKEKAIPRLKSTRDPRWLYQGLTAISMDDFSGTFDDPEYIAYPMTKGDALFLLADLYVTAEEVGINPESICREISEISSPKSTKYVSMKEMIGKAGHTQFAYERRQHGKFVGMF